MGGRLDIEMPVENTNIAIVLVTPKYDGNIGAVARTILNFGINVYREILKCYEYETRNPSIYGNVIRCEMEFAQGSEQLQLNIEGNEDNLQ